MNNCRLKIHHDLKVFATRLNYDAEGSYGDACKSFHTWFQNRSENTIIIASRMKMKKMEMGRLIW